MTPQEFAHLRMGDIIAHTDEYTTYIVTGNYGDHVTVVRTIDIANPTEWDVRYKAKMTPTGEV